MTSATPTSLRPTVYGTPHLVPGPDAVLREHVRAVGLSLRTPAMIAAALLLVATVGVTSEALRGVGGLDFAPESSLLPGVAALLLPIALWRRDDPFGAAFPWTLPVERRGHALARVGAGWVWLMAAIAAFMLWQLAVALLTGGNVLGEETLRLVPTATLPAPGTLGRPPTGALDPAVLQEIRWMPRPILWLAPFTGATAVYLLVNAFALGSRHPLRWAAGALLGAFLAAALVSEVGMAASDQRLAHAPSRVLETFLFGTYGVDALLTARTESLRTVAVLADGGTATVWLGLPDLGAWGLATLLWTAAGAAALLAAAERHRERHRERRRG